MPFALFLLPLMSACFGGNSKCEGSYGDVWLPAGSDSIRYDTGWGDGESECPDGFELLKVVTEKRGRWSYDATFYCVEQCETDE